MNVNPLFPPNTVIKEEHATQHPTETENLLDHYVEDGDVVICHSYLDSARHEVSVVSGCHVNEWHRWQLKRAHNTFPGIGENLSEWMMFVTRKIMTSDGSLDMNVLSAIHEVMKTGMKVKSRVMSKYDMVNAQNRLSDKCMWVNLFHTG